MPVEDEELEEVCVWQTYAYASEKQPRRLSHDQNPVQGNSALQNRRIPRSRQHSTPFSHFHEQLGYDRDVDDTLMKIEEGVIAKANILDTILKEKIVHMLLVYFDQQDCPSPLPDNEGGRTMDASPNRLILFGKKLINLTNGTMPWSEEFIRNQMPFKELFVFVELCLRGMGQVVFQNNPLSGLLILAGLFTQSTRVATHGMIGIVSGTLIAYLLGFEKGLRQSGLFGYNSLLCGLAMATFDDPRKHQGYSIAILMSTILFSSFSSILFIFMGKILVPYKCPPFTLPFNVSILMYLLATANTSRLETGSVSVPKLPLYETDVDTAITISGFFAGCIRGVGQIFLADNIISGLLILLGIAVCSRISAIVALFGSIIGAAAGVAIGVSGAQIENGIFGFNPCLTVIAMYLFYAPSQSLFMLASLAGVMTVIAQQALATCLQPYGLPFMTLPFCVITLLFVVIQGTSSTFIAIPLSSITVPEDHLEKIRALREGFQFLKEALYPDNAVDFLSKGDSNPDKRGVLGIILHRHSNNKETNQSQETQGGKETQLPEKFKPAGAGLSGQTFGTRNRNMFFWNLLSRTTTELRSKHSWVLNAAPEVFEALDSKKLGYLTIDDIQVMLHQVGLNDKSGLRFATLVLKIVNINKCNKIGRDEWVKFCLISVQLRLIRRKVSKFLEFVNLEQIDFIYIRELDAALDYLGKPGLSDADRFTLYSVLHLDNIEDIKDDPNKIGINVVDLINFVTISKVKNMMNELNAEMPIN